MWLFPPAACRQTTSRSSNTVASDRRSTARRPAPTAPFLINRPRSPGETPGNEIVLSRWTMDSPLWGSTYHRAWRKHSEEVRLARTADPERVVKNCPRSKRLGWRSSTSEVCNVFWKSTTVVRMSRVCLRRRRRLLPPPPPPRPRVVLATASASSLIIIRPSWDFAVTSATSFDTTAPRTYIDINTCGKIPARHSSRHHAPKPPVRQRRVSFPRRHRPVARATGHRAPFIPRTLTVTTTTNPWVRKTRSCWTSSPGGNKVNEKLSSVHVGS